MCMVQFRLFLINFFIQYSSNEYTTDSDRELRDSEYESNRLPSTSTGTRLHFHPSTSTSTRSRNRVRVRVRVLLGTRKILGLYSRVPVLVNNTTLHRCRFAVLHLRLRTRIVPQCSQTVTAHATRTKPTSLGSCEPRALAAALLSCGTPLERSLRHCEPTALAAALLSCVSACVQASCYSACSQARRTRLEQSLRPCKGSCEPTALH